MSVLEVDGRPVALSNLDKVIWRDAGPVGRGGARPSSGRADCLRFGPGDVRRRIHRYGDLFEALR